MHQWHWKHIQDEVDRRECDCFRETTTESKSYKLILWEDLWEDGKSRPAIAGALEVSNKTIVTVSATAYDARPGASSAQQSCREVDGDGCGSASTIDGIIRHLVPRWPRAAELVDGAGAWAIEYTFGEPQDIVDIQKIVSRVTSASAS